MVFFILFPQQLISWKSFHVFIGHKTIDFLLVRGCFHFLHMFNRIVFFFPICSSLYSLDRNFFVIMYLLLCDWPCYFADCISFLFLAALGLHCCTGAFSSCSEQGLLCSLSERASHCCGLSGFKASSRHVGSVVVTHGLSSSSACGIFPDQGANLEPLHWQVDSYPVGHQGSPKIISSGLKWRCQEGWFLWDSLRGESHFLLSSCQSSHLPPFLERPLQLH